MSSVCVCVASENISNVGKKKKRWGGEFCRCVSGDVSSTALKKSEGDIMI